VRGKNRAHQAFLPRLPDRDQINTALKRKAKLRRNRSKLILYGIIS
jgi:hypothetical protein